MLAPEAAYWLRQQGLEDLVSRTPLGPATSSHVTRYTFACGRQVVWKEQPGMSFDYFQAEADGIAAIRATQSIAVPQLYFVGESGLLMEDLQPATPTKDYWEQLGRRLAQMHQHLGPGFGFHKDNYIGLSHQSNPLTFDGYEFFADARLLAQASNALERGLLSHHQMRQVETLAAQLRDWIPDQPAVLIHGDLWSGNLMSNVEGEPALIDPAAHWGWAIADLAMTELFGGFAEGFYEAYLEIAPQARVFRESAWVLNLYHQLNHLNLFGLSYAESVRRALDRVGKQV